MTPEPTTIAEPLTHPESTSGNHGAACWVHTQFATGKKPSAAPMAANATASHRESRRVVRGGLATCEERFPEKGRATRGGIVTLPATPAETLRLGRPCVLRGNSPISLDFDDEVL